MQNQPYTTSNDNLKGNWNHKSNTNLFPQGVSTELSLRLAITVQSGIHRIITPRSRADKFNSEQQKLKQQITSLTQLCGQKNTNASEQIKWASAHVFLLKKNDKTSINETEKSPINDVRKLKSEKGTKTQNATEWWIISKEEMTLLNDRMSHRTDQRLAVHV